jgi:hypothetical protein
MVGKSGHRCERQARHMLGRGFSPTNPPFLIYHQPNPPHFDHPMSRDESPHDLGPSIEAPSTPQAAVPTRKRPSSSPLSPEPDLHATGPSTRELGLPAQRPKVCTTPPAAGGGGARDADALAPLASFPPLSAPSRRGGEAQRGAGRVERGEFEFAGEAATAAQTALWVERMRSEGATVLETAAASAICQADCERVLLDMPPLTHEQAMAVSAELEDGLSSSPHLVDRLRKDVAEGFKGNVMADIFGVIARTHRAVLSVVAHSPLPCPPSLSGAAEDILAIAHADPHTILLLAAQDVDPLDAARRLVPHIDASLAAIGGARAFPVSCLLSYVCRVSTSPLVFAIALEPFGRTGADIIATKAAGDQQSVRRGGGGGGEVEGGRWAADLVHVQSTFILQPVLRTSARNTLHLLDAIRQRLEPFTTSPSAITAVATQIFQALYTAAWIRPAGETDSVQVLHAALARSRLTHDAVLLVPHEPHEGHAADAPVYVFECGPMGLARDDRFPGAPEEGSMVPMLPRPNRPSGWLREFWPNNPNKDAPLNLTSWTLPHFLVGRNVAKVASCTLHFDDAKGSTLTALRGFLGLYRTSPHSTDPVRHSAFEGGNCRQFAADLCDWFMLVGRNVGGATITGAPVEHPEASSMTPERVDVVELASALRDRADLGEEDVYVLGVLDMMRDAMDEATAIQAADHEGAVDSMGEVNSARDALDARDDAESRAAVGSGSSARSPLRVRRDDDGDGDGAP